MADTVIPDGHYAVPAPDHPDQRTYWQARRGVLTPWPRRGRYGPWATTPAYDRPAPGSRAYLALLTAHTAWMDAIRTAIAADPAAAQRRFAGEVVRCWICGRRLTDPASRQRGLGPDCWAEQQRSGPVDQPPA